MQQVGVFEMRRLEMLSNTIFGVAMTLLAYDLPKASSFRARRAGSTCSNVYAQPVIALMISFIVAGLFWFSHHRRLAVAPEGSRGVVFLNLVFLLSIIILPVTNGLYGSYRLDSVVAVIYGGHLLTIATLNGLLWILALRGRSDAALLVTAIFPILVFVHRNGRRLSLSGGGAVHVVPRFSGAVRGLARRTALRARRPSRRLPDQPPRLRRNHPLQPRPETPCDRGRRIGGR